MLPIVQREMAVAARRKTTYAFRALAGLIAFLMLFVMWLDMRGSVGSTPSGQALLWSMTVVGCAAAAWQGTIRAARCLSEERANGTLGLLFLTPLKTADVVLGKFTTAALLALQIAVTLAPMLAVTILFGGVSIGEVSRAALWVANVSFFFIAASMLASALTASEVAAMALSLLFAVATIVFALHDMDSGVNSLPLNPVTAWAGVSDVRYQERLYWPGMITAQGAGWMMLGLTALALKQNWHRAEVCPALKFLWTRTPRPKKSGTVCKLGKNGPVEWLIVRNVFRWAPLILVLLCFAVSLPFRDDSIKGFMGGVATLVLGVGVVVHSALAVARAKKGGMLDLLAVAPMSDEEIVDGQIRGLKRLFFVPAVLVVVWFLMLVPWRATTDYGGQWMSLYYVATIPLTLWAGAYSGIWMALKSKGPVMAVTRNAALAVVLPWVLPVPAGLFLFVLGMMARRVVRTEFRALLAKRSQPALLFPEIQRDESVGNVMGAAASS